MSRVLVLIGAFLFFRAVPPRNSRSSNTAISPYINALDGAMSAQQVSSVLDEVMPYKSWLAGRRSNGRVRAQLAPFPLVSAAIAKRPVTDASGGSAENPRP